MTINSPNQDTPVTKSTAVEYRVPESAHRSRYRKSLRRSLKRRLRKTLRPRNLFRTAVVVLPLAAFVYVSHINGVLSRSTGNAVAVSNADVQIRSSRLLSSGDPAYRSSNDMTTSGSVALAPSSEKPEIHVVNQGGSLWRTGKRFIDDDRLLDKYIDSLALNGMDVRNVRAGVEFRVSKSGGNGLRVLVEMNGSLYESRVTENEVVTTSRPVKVADENIESAA